MPRRPKSSWAFLTVSLADEPRLQLVVVGLDHLPGRSVAIGPVGTHLLADLGDEQVVDLGFTLVSDKPLGRRGM